MAPAPQTPNSQPANNLSNHSAVWDVLKYVLGVAVSAFLAGVGVIAFVDKRITEVAPIVIADKFVSRTQAEEAFAAKSEHSALSQRLGKLEELARTQAEAYASRGELSSLSQRLGRLEDQKTEVWFSKYLEVHDTTEISLGQHKFCALSVSIQVSGDQTCGCSVSREPEGSWNLRTSANSGARQGSKCLCQAACIK